MSGDTALTLAKNYVKKTLQGQGALKGQDGFSPIIEENADNTDKVYKLDITTADSAFTTPNLRGKDGECSGGGEANVIESISVNGTHISVDENKNVDITVPSIDGLAKTEDIPTKVSELTNDSNYQTAEQVNSTVTTEIAKVVADAPEDLNTLKEMSDWIAGHEDDASAMNSAISDNKTAIAALQKGKADKSEIPTTLPANGGNADTVNNHNVESDVPANAKFTDTIYDDTAVKESIEELNSNLDSLGYGDESGNSNLLNLNKCSFNKNNISISLEDNEITVNGSYYSNLLFDKLLDAGSYSISFKVKSATSDYSVIRVLYEDGTYSDEIYHAKNIVAEKKLKGLMLYSSDNADVGTAVFKNIQIEKGTTATPYKPYIPSVKMLAEENAQQNTEVMDLKMLGWTVPSECPVQNYVDGDGVFHQRIGRVDLGSLEWTYDTLWKATSGVSTIKNLTVNMYHSVYVPTIANVSDMPTNSVKKADSDTLWINNGSSTEKPSGYLYFELATEKTINVDGNEAVTKVNDSLDVIGKCKNLLNPTLETTTLNGVTCTNNGDGTYTINGTATQNTDFTFFDNLEKYQHLKNRTVKLVGCPKGGSDTTYRLMLQLQQSPWPSAIDIGKGSSVTVDNNDNWACWIRIYKDATVSNLTFKPMLVFDDKTPNATYDDFVPYTGDGDTLTHDVAKLKNDLAPKKIELQNVDERVTIQDNGSFIINGFAFVNLLVTFNETLPQWSNFVRLPRPKGGNVSVHCENSVRLTIYSQDNLPGDCGTYETVASGTEIRLLVNYEVA